MNLRYGLCPDCQPTQLLTITFKPAHCRGGADIPDVFTCSCRECKPDEIREQFGFNPFRDSVA